jgi:hypothetical protein
MGSGISGFDDSNSTSMNRMADLRTIESPFEFFPDQTIIMLEEGPGYMSMEPDRRMSPLNLS